LTVKHHVTHSIRICSAQPVKCQNEYKMSRVYISLFVYVFHCLS